MVSPDTVRKLKLLKVLVDAHGGHEEIAEFNQIVSAFQENETLTRAEAAKANKIYNKLKRFKT